MFVATSIMNSTKKEVRKKSSLLDALTRLKEQEEKEKQKQEEERDQFYSQLLKANSRNPGPQSQSQSKNRLKRNISIASNAVNGDDDKEDDDLEDFRLPKKRKLLHPEEKLFDLSNISSLNTTNEVDASNSSDNLESDAPELNVGSDEVSAVDAALSMDHILELIFFYLRNTDLTKTRLVSRRFSYFSSKQLEKNLKILISFPAEYESSSGDDDDDNNNNNNNNNNNDITIMTNSGRFEKDLDSLVNILSTIETSPKFPCLSFNLNCDALSGPYITQLFTYHGTYIKVLKLSLNYISRNVTELMLLSELKTVLMDQAPNVQELEINAFISMIDRCQWLKVKESKSELENDSEDTNDDTSSKPFQLPRLKSLNILGASYDLFVEIMEAASNLQTYIGHHSEYLKYFISGRGISRLHLLKHLNIVPNTQFLSMLESIATFMETKEMLEIERFQFNLKYIYDRPYIWPRVSKVINRILKCGAKSALELDWESMRFLHGVQIPVMPKVKELLLLELPNAILEQTFEKQYFPVGFDMAGVFPCLRSITVFNEVTQPGFSFSTLIDLFQLAPVPSVKNVNFKNPNGVHKEEREVFFKVFPSATFLAE